MNKSTLVEALTAELLGDVGLLNDQIKELRCALPALIQEAGLQAEKSMQATINKAITELERAGRAEQQAAANLQADESALQKRMAAASKAASEAELVNIQRRFNKIAAQVLEQIRCESTNAAPSAWKAKVTVGLTISLLFVGSAGIIIGSIWNEGTFFISRAEAKQLAFGKKMDRVLSTLDKETLTKIVDASKNVK